VSNEQPSITADKLLRKDFHSPEKRESERERWKETSSDMLVINIKDFSFLSFFLGLLLGLGPGFSITIYGTWYAQLSAIRFAKQSKTETQTHTLDKVAMDLVLSWFRSRLNVAIQFSR